MHPGIYFPPKPQEIHFFDLDENYGRGLSWYESLFADAPEGAVVGQTSPLYMYLPKVTERIAATVPGAKFIFILRDPVTRAYSHYWNSVRYGYETMSFEQALELEPVRLERGDFEKRHYSYIDRGFYGTQINRYAVTFGRDKLLVLTQDELRVDPSSVLEKCAHFLAVDPAAFPSSRSNGVVHNPSRLPRSRQMQRLRPALENAGLNKLTRILDKINLIDCKYPALNSRVANSLATRFVDDLAILDQIIQHENSFSSLWAEGTI